MSRTFTEGTPRPPLPSTHIASMTSPKNSTTHSRRTSNLNLEQLKSSAKPGPNDIRNNPPSSEVITDLLASLSSISLPDSEKPFQTAQTTVRTEYGDGYKYSTMPRLSRKSPFKSFSRPTQPRRTTMSATVAPQASQDAIGTPDIVYQSAPVNNQELYSVDAAEPPVVPTSRRPSGWSKLSLPKSKYRPKSSDGADPCFSVPPTPDRLPLMPPPAASKTFIQSFDGAAEFQPPRESSKEEQASASISQGGRKHVVPEIRRSPMPKRGTDLDQELPRQDQREPVKLHTPEPKGKERAVIAATKEPQVPERSRRPKNTKKKYSSATIYSPHSSTPSHSLTTSNTPARSPLRSTANSIIEEDVGLSEAGPSQLSGSSPTAAEFLSPRKLSAAGIDSGVAVRDFIPKRQSSLRHSSKSPPYSARESRRSSLRRSPDAPRKEELKLSEEDTDQSRRGEQEKRKIIQRVNHIQNRAIEARRFEQQQSLSSEELSVGKVESNKQEVREQAFEEDLDLDENMDVMARLRRLRAAKEERDRNHLQATAGRIEESPPPPPQPPKIDEPAPTPSKEPPARSQEKPKITTRADKQLAEAGKVEEQPVREEDADNDKYSWLTPSIPMYPGIDPTVDLTPPELQKSPRPKATTLAVSPQSQTRLVNSKHSPNTSRSNSRVKRWSHDLPSPHWRDRSKNAPSMMDEPRSSIDSVNDSVQEYLHSSRLSQKVWMDNGDRAVSFSEVGDPNGFVVFCCVGMGLTKYIMAFYEELASSLKLRLITPERPGVGDSAPYEDQKSPLYWPDDVMAICNRLSIKQFSLLAHSAGAIYALAAALKLPSRIRGRVHLLAPWIPPSQMAPIPGTPSPSANGGTLPRSQRFLRHIPTPFLRLSNASFMSGVARGANQKTPSSKSRKSVDNSPRPSVSQSERSTNPFRSRRSSTTDKMAIKPSTPNLGDMVSVPSDHDIAAAVLSAGSGTISSLHPPTDGPLPRTPTRPSNVSSSAARQRAYDAALTPRLWELATRNSNPAADLIVCLERHQAIGYRYADVPREVVIHHGAKDTRVPLENVRIMLQRKGMQKAELQVLEGEGHGLMGSAGVMTSVLSEVAGEWERGVDGRLGVGTGASVESFV